MDGLGTKWKPTFASRSKLAAVFIGNGITSIMPTKVTVIESKREGDRTIFDGFREPDGLRQRYASAPGYDCAPPKAFECVLVSGIEEGPYVTFDWIAPCEASSKR